MRNFFVLGKSLMLLAVAIFLLSSCNNDCKNWSNTIHGSGAQHYKINRENTNKNRANNW